MATSMFFPVKGDPRSNLNLNLLPPFSYHPLQMVFIGDLSYFCTEIDLTDYFSSVARVIQCRVRRGKKGQSLLHGFVILETVQDAIVLVNELHETEFMGRKIKLILSKKHLPENEAKVNVTKPLVAPVVRVHFSFISKDVRHLITESVLKDIMLWFGEIEDISIKKHSLDMKRQSGYGFVFFRRKEDANNAKRQFMVSSVNGIVFDFHVHDQTDSNLLTKQNAGKLSSAINFGKSWVESNYATDNRMEDYWEEVEKSSIFTFNNTNCNFNIDGLDYSLARKYF